MAELKLTIKKDKARELANGGGVELTDEVYGKLNYNNQLLVNLHEKFIGPVTTVGEFQGNYYVRREEAEAIAKAMKLV